MSVCGHLVNSRIPKAYHSHIHRCIWSLSHWPTQKVPILVLEPILPLWSYLTPGVWVGFYYPTQPLTSPWLMSILGNHVCNSKDVEGVWTWIYTHRGLLREHLFKVGYCFILFPGAGDGEIVWGTRQTGKVRAGSLRQLLLIPRKHWEGNLGR